MRVRLDAELLAEAESGGPRGLLGKPVEPVEDQNEVHDRVDHPEVSHADLERGPSSGRGAALRAEAGVGGVDGEQRERQVEEVNQVSAPENAQDEGRLRLHKL